MQQKYVYSGNVFWNFLKGVLFTNERGTHIVAPFRSPNKLFVWRNTQLDGYKITDDFQDKPTDLSNYLFIRTRERLLLLNRVYAPHKVLSKGKNNSYQEQYSTQSLREVEEDLAKHLPNLERLIKILNPEKNNLPVAFASNALYILEKNGLGNREEYERVLLPVLRQKIQHIHAEGVSQSVWALANAQIWDEQLWGSLKQLAIEKTFDYQVVKNERWSATHFQTPSTLDHMYQSAYNSQTNQMFFGDKLNFFELYSGLQLAHSANPALGLGDTVKQLEQKYSHLLTHNSVYRALEDTQRELEAQSVPATKEAHNA
ncbi:UNKNOWN [Stylonychia lemnae]|uniref:Uncharacterized protein n=1 Tax=Stylonychia lemnae TaxID=5949 RepID=A0A078APR2_STYLE|nr:UNKNOWN [Stylonychia lemnae]|eukprot:CDW84360.1 UNKNOWN [Stylonychia lemnae]